jgi:UDP-N-acetylglucosamine--N-acetylmuramyl-(pentapeptide) pyrophosphoryl-undecaprenol N-acetylglucosamine transferase
MTLLVMGGSRGAHQLNQIVTQAICETYRLGHKIQAIHLSGKDDEAAVRAAYKEASVPGVVHGFTQDMASIYAQSDLAICRSGASTCSELSAFGVPALLVPYPHAANDHQTANARAMEKVGAADIVPEKDLSVDWLKDYISQSIRFPGRLAKMSAATKGRVVGEAAEALADLVVQVGRGENGTGGGVVSV